MACFAPWGVSAIKKSPVLPPGAFQPLKMTCFAPWGISAINNGLFCLLGRFRCVCVGMPKKQLIYNKNSATNTHTDCTQTHTRIAQNTHTRIAHKHTHTFTDCRFRHQNTDKNTHIPEAKINFSLDGAPATINSFTFFWHPGRHKHRKLRYFWHIGRTFINLFCPLGRFSH